MKYIYKYGCFLIGWNYEILSQCGEASKRQFFKLLSAIMIMMLLWGTIGYCFANNYIFHSENTGIEYVFYKMLVSMFFIFLIVNIERVIILTVGKARIMEATRFILALMMAVLGSCIFDQIIFRNDIKEELTLQREVMVKQIVANRVEIIDKDVARLEYAMDSLSKNISALSDEISQKPVIHVTNVSRSTTTGPKDEYGNAQKNHTTTIQQQAFENPKTQQLRSCNELYAKYNAQVDTLSKQKINIQQIVINEVMNKPTGFIEELNATVAVISKSWPSLVFYIVLFLVLMCMELFVVSIKVADNKCDYDLLVEHQLSVKSELFKKTEEELKKNMTKGTNGIIPM